MYCALSFQMSRKLPLSPFVAASKASISAKGLSLLASGTSKYSLASVSNQETTEFADMPFRRHATLTEPGSLEQCVPAAAHDGCGLLSREERRTVIVMSAAADTTRLTTSHIHQSVARSVVKFWLGLMRVSWCSSELSPVSSHGSNLSGMFMTLAKEVLKKPLNACAVNASYLQLEVEYTKRGGLDDHRRLVKTNLCRATQI